MKRTRVLIVDDSALVRRLLTTIFVTDPGIEVLGAASDPYVAREMIKSLNPDVLTLDVEMPRMDGLTFLGNLMRLRPMPVVMVSSLTEAGADVTLDALELGAVDFVTKPKVDLAQGLNEYAGELIAKVKMAAHVNVQRLERRPGALRVAGGTHELDAMIPAVPGASAAPRHFRTTDRIIAIGASTGGTEAIKDVLVAMPPDAPGIVITQHIPSAFSGSFARRLDGLSAMTVCEARDGQQIVPGHAYIAPGGRHLSVERSGARFLCRLEDGPAVNRHKPSVDVLFRSVARNAGGNAVGAILTGMGDDGAEGLKAMRAAGARTMAQDEKTSVVWGMPGSAVKAGAVEEILPLCEIAARLLRLATQ
ncbi:MAG: chemotaxis response regulator protein-glutamate methylesterase [Gammaproteobacteria bacterium]